MKVCIARLALRDVPEILDLASARDTSVKFTEEIYRVARGTERGRWLLEHCTSTCLNSQIVTELYDTPIDMPVLELHGVLGRPGDQIFFRLLFGE
jgi:hypothetical protein